MFSYCYGDPINKIDPTGFLPCEPNWWDESNHDGNGGTMDPLPHLASFFADFSPFDFIKDVADLVRGKDSFTGESQSRVGLVLAVILPGSLDGLAKKSAKSTTKLVSKKTKNFNKSYSKLPKAIQKAADKQFQIFKVNPYHPSLNFEKLEGLDNIWSARVQGKYRAYGKMENGVMIGDDINAHDYKVLGR